MSNVEIMTCCLCNRENILCFWFFEDNGYTQDYLCKKCLLEMVEEIETEEAIRADTAVNKVEI